MFDYSMNIFLSIYHGQFWRNDDEQQGSGSVGLSETENTHHWNHGSVKVKNLLTVQKEKQMNHLPPRQHYEYPISWY